MSKPIRIQRKRTQGWKMPDHTVVVTRGTKWGNPFVVNPNVVPGSGRHDALNIPTVEDAVACYREYILLKPEAIAALPELRGKNLACWCKPGEPCHADVLLELANAIAAVAFAGRLTTRSNGRWTICVGTSPNSVNWGGAGSRIPRRSFTTGCSMSTCRTARSAFTPPQEVKDLTTPAIGIASATCRRLGYAGSWRTPSPISRSNADGCLQLQTPVCRADPRRAEQRVALFDCEPKRQTIRAIGKRRHARPGETLQLYHGMRSAECFLIGTARCISIEPITIKVPKDDAWLWVRIGTAPSFEAGDAFAIADGFENIEDMWQFWRSEPPDHAEFQGFLIKWEAL